MFGTILGIFLVGSIGFADAFSIPVEEPKPPGSSRMDWGLIFVTSFQECSSRNIQAMEFYYFIAWYSIAQYNYDNAIVTIHCVSIDDYFLLIQNVQNEVDLPITILDYRLSNIQRHTSDSLGHFNTPDWSGYDVKNIVSQAKTLSIENTDTAWTLSHEIAHSSLDWRGYNYKTMVNAVHDVQEGYRDCKNQDTTLSRCQPLWTTAETPSGKYFPIMKANAVFSIADDMSPKPKPVPTKPSDDPYQSQWKDVTNESRYAASDVLEPLRQQCWDSFSLGSNVSYESPIAINYLKEAIDIKTRVCDAAEDFKLELNRAIQLEIKNKYSDAGVIYDGIARSVPGYQDSFDKIAGLIKLVDAAEIEFHKQKLIDLEKEQEDDEFFEENEAEMISFLNSANDDMLTKTSQIDKALIGLEYQNPDANMELDNAWKFRRSALDSYEKLVSAHDELLVLVNNKDRDGISAYSSKNGDSLSILQIKFDKDVENVFSLIDKANALETEYQQQQGGCLIATATYGSELSQQVQMLREIRDNSLLQTELGSAFMKSFNQFYYSFSPSIADLERENPIFKEAVKLTIMPLLSSLSLLNYVDMESEVEILTYGIGLILLNIGMYFVAPVGIVVLVRRKSENS